MVGHGSSDNAATYGVYAFGLLPRLTAVRDSISLSVYYEAELDFSASVVLALSQSGRTPDVVEYVERARARGALTVALTNENASELEQVAHVTLPLAAGAESAVAATKTYVNELAALALLAGGIAGRGVDLAEAVRNLHALGVPLEDALTAATAVPARVIAEPNAGRLDVGLAADVVVLDDSLEIERVLLGGEARVVV